MLSVDVNIVSWNSQETIAVCLDSVLKQDFPNLNISVYDNASSDRTISILQKYAEDIRIIHNQTNLGFSKAHNQAIQSSQGAYILVLNPDVYLSPGYISEAVKTAEQYSAGAVNGRLYAVEKDSFLKQTFHETILIDCIGLEINKNRQLTLRGHYQADNPQFDLPVEVFGADGAAPLFKKEMLEDIRLGDEYFDEDFFAYKEDHDLAWRARLYGWKTMYSPLSKAYHIRTTRPGERKKMKPKNRVLGIRNRYLLIAKNDLLPLVWKDILQISWYELKIIAYILLLERGSFQAYGQAKKMLPLMKAKRTRIMQHKRLSPEEIYRWFQ